VVDSGLPAVLHGGSARTDLPVVGIDDRAAAHAIGCEVFRAARRPTVLSFPLDRCRRSMLLVGPEPEAATFPVTRHRLQGLRDAWLETGRPWSEVRVAVCSTNDAALGAEHVAELLAGAHAPDAVAAMSDELALGALRAATDAGLPVPDVLAVTGWDDTAAAAPAGLTTISQSLRAQGAQCARLALGRDSAPGRPDWHLVRRRTTRQRP
ncbi:MAG TPA: substrate-binding domain-containing protein, partial [Cryptosporangiaceae bacterium]|nr:substrate-binding domain-containing protein [Cryptosporangiaceae bacterium]